MMTSWRGSYRNFCAVCFSQEFLKKEFSEENILFWQACEYFSHVPATDKKQVSRKCAATDALMVMCCVYCGSSGTGRS